MDNSPLFKKFYQQWVETMRAAWEKEQLRGIEQMRKAQTERRIILLVILLAIGVAAATMYLMNGGASYCEYPDPYGR